MRRRGGGKRGGWGERKGCNDERGEVGGRGGRGGGGLEEGGGFGKRTRYQQTHLGNLVFLQSEGKRTVGEEALRWER